MTDESQQEEEELLTEKEKECLDELKERRCLSANNGHAEGETEQVYEYRDKAETDNLVTDVNDQTLETEADATKRKRDTKISACFEEAKQKLEGLLKSKKQVIQDLAYGLERLGRRTEDIAAEIVAELCGCEEISLIYAYLDNKYKDPAHASRRKGKTTKKPVPETGTESAAEAVIPALVMKTKTSGQETVESAHRPEENPIKREGAKRQVRKAPVATARPLQPRLHSWQEQ